MAAIVEELRMTKGNEVSTLQRSPVRYALTLFSFVIVACVGCSDRNFATVKGTVSLDDKPLDGGSVVFYPKAPGPLAYSDISPDGSYELRTASRAGLVPATYVAIVSYRSGLPSSGMTLRQIQALEKVPIRYCDKDTSDLHEDVKPGKNSIDLKLTKNK
jgi:hypothetical protein